MIGGRGGGRTSAAAPCPEAPTARARHSSPSTRNRRTRPDWSPDGSKIAYLADTHGIADTVSPNWGDIWVMNADGSNQRPITASPGHPTAAASPPSTCPAAPPTRSTHRTEATRSQSTPGRARSTSPAGNRAATAPKTRTTANQRRKQERCHGSSELALRPLPFSCWLCLRRRVAVARGDRGAQVDGGARLLNPAAAFSTVEESYVAHAARARRRRDVGGAQVGTRGPWRRFASCSPPGGPWVLSSRFPRPSMSV